MVIMKDDAKMIFYHELASLPVWKMALPVWEKSVKEGLNDQGSTDKKTFFFYLVVKEISRERKSFPLRKGKKERKKLSLVHIR